MLCSICSVTETTPCQVVITSFPFYIIRWGGGFLLPCLHYRLKMTSTSQPLLPSGRLGVDRAFRCLPSQPSALSSHSRCVLSITSLSASEAVLGDGEKRNTASESVQRIA